MGYDQYTERAISSWDFASQMALWRERALHQAARAAFYKSLVEAEKTGATIKASSKEPAA